MRAHISRKPFTRGILATAISLLTVPASAEVPALSGTWDNGSGIDFVQPVRDGDSICLIGCAPPPADPGALRPPPDRPKYRTEFRARVADLTQRQVEEDPVLRCMPPGVPRIGPPDKIVQTEKEVIFLYEDVSGDFHRIVPVDGRPHRDDVEPTYLGDAIGHYDGDALVVETLNFTDDTWLTDDGSIHTGNLRVVERIWRDGDNLMWQATAYDPDVLAEPWQMRPRVAVPAKWEIVETPPCLERDLDHIVDGSYHANPR